MNVKSRAIGIVAAAALVLGLTSGALAQDDTITTTVTLDDGPCTASVDQAAIDFGTYSFDGERFTSGESGSSGSFSVSAVDDTVAQDGCDVDIVASDLTATSTTIGIPVELTGGGATPGSAITVTVLETSPVTITASIFTTLSNNLDATTYNGDITVTGKASSN